MLSKQTLIIIILGIFIVGTGVLLTRHKAIPVRQQSDECSQSVVSQLPETELGPVTNADPNGEVVTICVAEFQKHVGLISLLVEYRPTGETEWHRFFPPKTTARGILRLRLPRGDVNLGLDDRANHFNYFLLPEAAHNLSVDGPTFFVFQVASPMPVCC